MSSEIRGFSGPDTIATSTDSGVLYKERPDHALQLRAALDPTMTRIAVELILPENHTHSVVTEPLLNSLRELLSLDCLFVAMFDKASEKIEWINTASVKIKNCNPHELIGEAQPCSKEMLQRLAKHQLLNVRDYNTSGEDFALFSSQISSLNLSSALIGGIKLCNTIHGFMCFGSLRRRLNWDAEMHLVLKLMSACYAAGYDRHLQHMQDQL